MAKWQLLGEIKSSHRIFYQKSSGFLLRPRNCMLLLEIHSEHSHSLRTECCARKTDIQQSIRVYCMAFSYHQKSSRIIKIHWKPMEIQQQMQLQIAVPLSFQYKIAMISTNWLIYRLLSVRNLLTFCWRRIFQIGKKQTIRHASEIRSFLGSFTIGPTQREVFRKSAHHILLPCTYLRISRT